MGLSINGETAEIIASGATILRSHAIKIKAPKEAIDTVGTGGDGANTLNISSAADFFVSGAGIPVAKHGNYSATSKSGAANVLESLGVNINNSVENIQDCINFLINDKKYDFCAKIPENFENTLKQKYLKIV